MRDAPKAERLQFACVANYNDIKSKPEFFEFGAEIEVLGLSLLTVCTHTATITILTRLKKH